ncbi:hypothetical protein AAF712_007296 [Marasmius tenuissimus]|uniref:BTB domain-containing protein n=1 Tax=Marasmius tenuissimus TaxID=585030 RepID=A0ABR2ZVD7_9AGAR
MTDAASDPAPGSPPLNAHCRNRLEVKPEPRRIRHSQYYIDESMSIFLVENQLFKIHRHFLRQESPIFDKGQEGETEDRPIVLPEITCDQFVGLMDCFYKGTFFKTKEPGTSFKEYKDLFSIATLYECSEAGQKAILGIESYNPIAVEKIVLAERHNVDRWLMPAYIQLCKRDNPLTRDEAWDIGLDKTIMIAAAREKIRFSGELSANFFEESRVQRVLNPQGVISSSTFSACSRQPSPPPVAVAVPQSIPPSAIPPPTISPQPITVLCA